LSRASVLYAKGPRRLRRVAVRVLPASFKRRIHERLGPTPFSKAPQGFVPTWENPDISLYLDPDYMHRSYVQRPQELVLEYIRQATQHSVAPLSLLDAGCGNGRLYRALADAGLLQKLEYRGADVTRKVVEAARTLYPDGVFDEGSIEKLPYTDGSFDIVVSNGTYNPNATCTVATCGTTAGFIATVFGPTATSTIPTFAFHYSAGKDGEWKNASADRGGNHGDISTA